MGDASDIPQIYRTLEQLLIKRDYEGAKKILTKLNINRKDAQGNTLLIRACLANDFERFKWLTQNGGDVKVRNKFGTPLVCIALKGGNFDITKLIMSLAPETVNEHCVGQSELVGRNIGAGIARAAQEDFSKTIYDLLLSHELAQIPRTRFSTGQLLKEEYNLLLLGETGVGKSTFINAFMNYFNFITLDEADGAEKVHSLIPSEFFVTGENFERTLIRCGSDPNEVFLPGHSTTQSARSYVFHGGNIAVRLIDTPGIGDARGIGQDEESFGKLLTAICELRNIHGICILLRPNNRIFEYSLMQLLSRLHKDACKNVIFIFTDSRSTSYHPGDIVGPLRGILDKIQPEIPFFEIPFEENVFCVDNEAFRFLLARRDGVGFDENSRESYITSWRNSRAACIQLLKYVKTLLPHQIENTIDLNEARRLVLRLNKPLLETIQHIQDNIDILDKYKEILSDPTKTVDELQQYLRVPKIGLRISKLANPRVVCTHINCLKIIKTGDITRIRYRQRCHDPCFDLSGNSAELVRDPQLLNCQAFRANYCQLCRHHYVEHMRIYYETEPYEYEEGDENVRDIGQDMHEIIQTILREISERKEEFKDEMDVIQTSMSRFTNCLTDNAITPFNDTYKEYIDYFIDRESKMRNEDHQARVLAYHKLISIYQGYKSSLSMQHECRAEQVTPNVCVKESAQEVADSLTYLCLLRLTGETIQGFYDLQRNEVGGDVLRTVEENVRSERLNRLFADVFN